MKKIILASNSPRRKEILSQTGLLFTVEGSNYEEDMSLEMSPTELVEYLSFGKAKSVADKNMDAIVIGADTFVVYNNKYLGKPETETRAREMLKSLSGKENEIITGVTIVHGEENHFVSFHEITKVLMKELSEETIEDYIKTGEPLDKAGGYALQGYGHILAEKIDGSLSNAMGLPIDRLLKELKSFGVKV